MHACMEKKQQQRKRLWLGRKSVKWFAITTSAVFFFSSQFAIHELSAWTQATYDGWENTVCLVQEYIVWYVRFNKPQLPSAYLYFSRLTLEDFVKPTSVVGSGVGRFDLYFSWNPFSALCFASFFSSAPRIELSFVANSSSRIMPGHRSLFLQFDAFKLFKQNQIKNRGNPIGIFSVHIRKHREFIWKQKIWTLIGLRSERVHEWEQRMTINNSQSTTMRNTWAQMKGK